MAVWLRWIPVVLVVMLMTSCGSEPSGGGQQIQSYKDTKSMVLDVLKTDEALKAFQEAQAKNMDGTTRLLSTTQGQQIQMAVKEVLTGSDQSKLLQKTITDPRFAADFAKALQQNMKQLHKDLMKDPDYQRSMVEVMKNPEFEKLVTGVMRNPAYRQQTMNLMVEAMQSPMFKLQLMELMQKAVEQHMTTKDVTLGAGSATTQQDKQSDGGGGDQESKQKDSGGGKDKSQDNKEESQS